MLNKDINSFYSSITNSNGVATFSNINVTTEGFTIYSVENAECPIFFLNTKTVIPYRLVTSGSDRFMVSQEIIPYNHEIKFKISNKSQQLAICNGNVVDWVWALDTYGGKVFYLTRTSNGTYSYTFQTNVEYTITLKDDVCTLSLGDTTIYSWTARSSRLTGDWYLRFYTYNDNAGFEYIKIKEL